MRALIQAVVLGSISAAAPALADPPEYALRYLGDAAYVAGINADGVIAGSRFYPGPIRGYVVGIDHPYELLPQPEGYESALISGMNDDGVIVGTILSNPLEMELAAAWYPDGEGGYTIQVLDPLPGHIHCRGAAINNRGDIVGMSIIPGYQGGPTVWFNSPDGTMDITDLGAPSDPADLNDSGVVVGRGGVMFDLDTLESSPLPPGGGGGIAAINEHGDLAGSRLVSHDCVGAVRWTETYGWQQLGGCADPSVGVGASDINDDHVTVGLMVGGSAYYDDEGLWLLNDLFAPEHALWSLDTRGCKINNAGQIATFAWNRNLDIGGVAILTPLGEMIIPGDVNGDAWVNLADHCAWQQDPIDLDGDGDADEDDEQWLIERLAGLGFEVTDCNENGIGDYCDIADGTSQDCDADGLPDECQPDCNDDGVPDTCEPDCNTNGVPDPCDILEGTSEDCNANGIPDECDDTGGTTEAVVVHDPPRAMLQNDLIVEELLVVDAGIVDDVNLALDLRYRIGFLTATLSHNGTTITILDLPGYPQYSLGFVNLGYDVIIDDEGTGPFMENAGDYCCNFEHLESPPSYRPDEPLSAFDGMPSEGVWTLTMTTTERWSPGDGLHGWRLTIERASVEVPPCCTEDVDGSGDVDFADVLAVLAAWGECDACPEDIDGSGSVDFADLLAVLAAWGPCE